MYVQPIRCPFNIIHEIDGFVNRFQEAITGGDHIWEVETPSKNRRERKTRKFAEPDFSPRMLQALGAMLDIVVYCYPNGRARWA